MCDLYLGDTNARASTPPTPFYTNPSIQNATYVFTAGVASPINVVLQNHDTVSGASAALVALYWSDPTTSFLLESANLIGNAVASIGAATTIPPADASVSMPFSWTPSTAAAATNGGHVCLAAVASSTSPDCIAPAPSGPGQTANTASPQVAIHNVHVNAAAPMPPPGGGQPRPNSGMPTFFFAATNGSAVAGKTRIVARALNPDDAADRSHLMQLFGLPSLQNAYGRGMKFGTPAEVLIALGPESLIARSVSGGARLGFTGPVAADFAEHLVKRAWSRGAQHQEASKEVELLPRQVQQVGVTVVPRHDDGRIYAIQIAHEMLGKPPVTLGGLTVVFAAPSMPW